MTLKYNKFGKKAAIPIELSEAEKIKIRAALKSLFKDLQYKLKIETTVVHLREGVVMAQMPLSLLFKEALNFIRILFI
jgi:hypothetical protein